MAVFERFPEYEVLGKIFWSNRCFMSDVFSVRLDDNSLGILHEYARELGRKVCSRISLLYGIPVVGGSQWLSPVEVRVVQNNCYIRCALYQGLAFIDDFDVCSDGIHWPGGNVFSFCESDSESVFLSKFTQNSITESKLSKPSLLWKCI